MTEPISTRWQSTDRSISLEFVDGLLVAVEIDSGLIDPARDEELETALIRGLDAAIQRHTDDHLNQIRNLDPVRERVEAFARGAREAAALSSPPARAVAESPESGATITWRDGSIVDVRLSYDLLARGRMRPVGDALIAAMNEEPEGAPTLDLEVLNSLTEESVRRDLADVAAAIDALEGRVR